MSHLTFCLFVTRAAFPDMPRDMLTYGLARFLPRIEGEVAHTIKTSLPTFMTFHPKRDMLAVVTNEDELAIWTRDAQRKWQVSQQMQLPFPWDLMGMTFSPCGKFLLIVHRNSLILCRGIGQKQLSSVRLCCPESSHTIAQPLLGIQLYDAAWHPKHPWRISLGHGNGCTTDWQIPSTAFAAPPGAVCYTRLVRPERTHAREVTSVCWSPCGKFLASCSLDKSLVVRTADRTECARAPIPSGPTDMQWSPCGKFLAVRAEKIHVFRYNHPELKKIHTFGHGKTNWFAWAEHALLIGTTSHIQHHVLVRGKWIADRVFYVPATVGVAASTHSCAFATVQGDAKLVFWE